MRGGYWDDLDDSLRVTSASAWPAATAVNACRGISVDAQILGFRLVQGTP